MRESLNIDNDARREVLPEPLALATGARKSFLHRDARWMIIGGFLVVCIIALIATISNAASSSSTQVPSSASGFPLGTAFKAFLESKSQTAKLVPGSYPIDAAMYDKWKRAMEANVKSMKENAKWKISEYPGILGDVRHVAFEEFLEAFITQMVNAEKILNESALLNDNSMCYLSYFRAGSGISVDDSSKSFGWMGRIFDAFLDWDEVDSSNVRVAPAKLRQCWDRTGRAITHGMSQKNSIGAEWDNTTDIVLVIEDVSYSGTELIQTASQNIRSNIKCIPPEKCPPNLLPPQSRAPRAIVFSTAFISNKVALGLAEAFKAGDIKTRLSKPVELVIKFPDEDGLHEASLYGVIFPNDLTQDTIACDRGVPSRPWKLESVYELSSRAKRQQEEYVKWKSQTDGKYPSSGGYQGGSCWIYFDHKMADYASLTRANILAATGTVLSPKMLDFHYFPFIDHAINESDAAKVTRAVLGFPDGVMAPLGFCMGLMDDPAPQFPFITGCEKVHRCSLKKFKEEAKHFVEDVGRGVEPRTFTGCSAKLKCPFAPYKNRTKYEALLKRCGC